MKLNNITVTCMEKVEVETFLQLLYEFTDVKWQTGHKIPTLKIAFPITHQVVFFIEDDRLSWDYLDEVAKFLNPETNLSFDEFCKIMNFKFISQNSLLEFLES